MEGDHQMQVSIKSGSQDKFTDELDAFLFDENQNSTFQTYDRKTKNDAMLQILENDDSPTIEEKTPYFTPIS